MRKPDAKGFAENAVKEYDEKNKALIAHIGALIGVKFRPPTHYRTSPIQSHKPHPYGGRNE